MFTNKEARAQKKAVLRPLSLEYMLKYRQLRFLKKAIQKGFIVVFLPPQYFKNAIKEE